jgi:hypothetical protein
MQATIRSTLGISEEQSRHTSGVQSRLWSSSVKARLAVGHKARHAATQAASCSPRMQKRVAPIITSCSPALRRPSRRLSALESVHDGRREFLHLNARQSPCTTFCDCAAFVHLFLARNRCAAAYVLPFRDAPPQSNSAIMRAARSAPLCSTGSKRGGARSNSAIAAAIISGLEFANSIRRPAR